MELYFNRNILDEIYSYMNWYSLRQMNNVPEYIWKHYYDYLCQDDDFKNDMVFDYSGCDNIPYRIRILNYIDYLLKYHNYESPKILTKDVDYAKHDIETFQDADDLLLSNKNFVQQFINRDASGIIYADPEIRYDDEILLTAANNMQIDPIPDNRQLYKNIVIAIIKHSNYGLDIIDPEIWQANTRAKTNYYKDKSRYDISYYDREATLNALSFGYPVNMINENFKGDSSLMLEILNCYNIHPNKILPYVDIKLRQNRYFIMACVEKSGSALCFSKTF